MTSDDLHLIAATNGGTRHLLALVPPGEWRIQGEDAATADTPAQAFFGIGDHQRIGVAYPASAYLIIHLVNSQPWETITTLLALVAERGQTIEDQAALLRQADTQIARLQASKQAVIQRLVAVGDWLLAHTWQLTAASQAELGQILRGEGVKPDDAPQKEGGDALPGHPR